MSSATKYAAGLDSFHVPVASDVLDADLAVRMHVTVGLANEDPAVAPHPGHEGLTAHRAVRRWHR